MDAIAMLWAKYILNGQREKERIEKFPQAMQDKINYYIDERKSEEDDTLEQEQP